MIDEKQIKKRLSREKVEDKKTRLRGPARVKAIKEKRKRGKVLGKGRSRQGQD